MTQQKKITVYRGSFVHSLSLESLQIIPSGTVGVDETGTITFIYASQVPSVDQIANDHNLATDQITFFQAKEEQGSFFFPGFVDTHIHASQYPNTGIFGDSTLLDWLNKFTFPLESSFSNLKRAKDVYSKVIDRGLSNGTTTASYYATVHVEATKLLADLALERKQRAFVGRVCMDSDNSPDFYRDKSHEEAKKADLEVIDYITKIDPDYDIVSPILTPRFAPSCTRESMKWMGKLMKENKKIPCQTHISENNDEIKWVRELFPESKSYADVYDKFGVLNERTTLAHAIHLSDEEKDLISERGCGISHCPISNSSIGSGIAPVRSLLDKNIKTSLGTDISGGYSPSILEVARQALTVSRLVAHFSGNDNDKLSSGEVLFLATLGGAQVCNLDDKVGSFEVGKKFDAQRIELNVKDTPVDLFDWFGSKEVITPEDRVKWFVEKWLFNGDDRNTRQVWVNGDLVVNKD